MIISFITLFFSIHILNREILTHYIGKTKFYCLYMFHFSVDNLDNYLYFRCWQCIEKLLWFVVDNAWKNYIDFTFRLGKNILAYVSSISIHHWMYSSTFSCLCAYLPLFFFLSNTLLIINFKHTANHQFHATRIISPLLNTSLQKRKQTTKEKISFRHVVCKGPQI